MCYEKFIRDNIVVVAPFLQLPVVIVPSPHIHIGCALRVKCELQICGSYNGVKYCTSCMSRRSTNPHFTAGKCRDIVLDVECELKTI